MKREIGNIENYYGGLSVKEEEGKYFWSIENYNGHRWDEIPKSLYDELVRYDESLKWISKVLGVQQKTSA